MVEFDIIKQKLTAFIRRYYLNELLKGSILFFSVWVLYSIVILLIEYFFWLSPPYRSLLFWVFILITGILFFRFILWPITKLFKLSKGLGLTDASILIGKHFPEVNDKLLNVLQLQNSSQQSDLLLASISQKSKELSPVPFKTAVNFNASLRYLKYAAFPILLILVILFTGNSSIFSESYTRVVHYNTAYEPPAPFTFLINEGDLIVEEGKDFNLDVKTMGKLVPENVAIHFNDEEYYLKNSSPNSFQYPFEGLKNDVEFYLSANKVTSRPYKISIIKVPKLLNFEMNLNFPAYLRKEKQTIKGTGNAVVPEGTKISWVLKTRTTEEVLFKTEDTILKFDKSASEFKYSDKIFAPLQYSVNTSNNEVKDYESLKYSIEVIKDQFPQINVQHKQDSIKTDVNYFFGKVTDDYAITKVNMVYYPENEKDGELKVAIPIPNQNVGEFLYTFPGGLDLVQGTNYSVYFEVFDNDGVRGAKSSKSELFNFRFKSEKELSTEKLEQQSESIQGISESLERMEESNKDLEELSRLKKQKSQLNYNDKKKLEEFLKRQKQQSEMMKSYSEKLQKSLEEKNSSEENKELQEQLKDRLERNEERLKENEQLLKELQDYADKISEEDLMEKLEKLSKQNTSEQKNLEQLLELTKRYYVQEKTQKLARDLEEIGEKQENLAKQDSLNSLENQKKLTEEFNEFKEEMKALEKENKTLKKPFELEREKTEEQTIQDEQKNAEEQLEQNNKEGAKSPQKEAGEKMKEMSKKMKSAQAGAQGEQLNANINSLRQILDNLMIFSFEEEALMLDFKGIRINNPAYPKQLRKQQVLKEHFLHIDDSLFVLAMNNPMISEKITSKLTDIEFDINKALERLAQNELQQGTASQQYVMTNTNELANMLSEVLNSMEEMANLSLAPNGRGEGMQLPDIIKAQEALNTEMQKGLNQGKGKSEEDGEDESGDKGKKGKTGNGEDGQGENRLDEQGSEKLYEIFKEQQQLRQQLEDKLREAGLDRKNAVVLNEMERIERQLLEKGFNKETLSRMNQIQHRLLQLEEAVREQEEEDVRTSKTNQENFKNTTQDQNIRAKEYFNSTEILNRQSLPLRQIYKTKVKRYFESVEN
ncbi:hypothetical protein BC962_0357 [Gillisia mitskevichiae]|uniref:Uncharacterized protein n=1 Tax=Gillisia mitskevichiae TaxID=270921 RepID=A0A495PW40_9FLAO|nr:DUF4175 family protein [Gillisia mitskevichiae]RKS55395.1 hypothetical protein BC962_0357 [Gillisia mitskevichiae]